MKSKGQIQYVFLLLIVAAIIAFAVLPRVFKGVEKVKESFQGPTYTPQSPVIEGESNISPVAEEEEKTVNMAADATSPQRFNAQPSDGLAPDTKKVSMSLETNENATCRYETDAGFFYEYMQYAFAETGSTFHSTPITTLSEGMGYVYYVRCMDETGNKNTNDFIINFYVKRPDDFTAPKRLNPYPTGDVFSAGASVTISVSTDEPAYCRYSLQQGVAYDSMRNNFSRNDSQIFHTVKINNLSVGNYEYFVRCKDMEGNVNTGDVMIYFTVSP